MKTLKTERLPGGKNASYMTFEDESLKEGEVMLQTSLCQTHVMTRELGQNHWMMVREGYAGSDRDQVDIRTGHVIWYMVYGTVYRMVYGIWYTGYNVAHELVYGPKDI